MHPVGLIIGHGYVKADGPAGTSCFPAVAALAPASEFTHALGEQRPAITLPSGEEWLVGQAALAYAPGRLVSILDRTRYASPSFLALALEALRLVVRERGPLRILTGMPAAWFSDAAARTQLAEVLVSAAQLWGPAQVTVAPEAAGVYYAWLFERGQIDLSRKAQRVGVIDAGYRDVNVAYFDAGRYVGGESVPGGMAESLKVIRRLIARQYRLELSRHEVDGAVRRGWLTVEGERVPLPAGTAEALTEGLETVIATGRSLWPNGGRSLDALILGGGGAHALAGELSRAFRQSYLLDQPQLAGARGFRVMATAAISRGA